MSATKKLILIQLFFCLRLFAQLPESGNFTLIGKINGKAPKQIRLQYINSSNRWTIDSTQVDQGKFKIKGAINGPTRAYLIGNLTSNTLPDPNLATIFLEPGLMEAEVSVDDFSSIKLKGSVTQNEYVPFDLKDRQLYAEWLVIHNALGAVKKAQMLNGNSKILQHQMDSLESMRSENSNAATQLRYQFVRTNGKSAVSASLMPNLIIGKTLSLDSADIIYNSFPQSVKNSTLGIQVKNAIKTKRAVVIGNYAPVLNGIDVNGDAINSKDYIGKKYVLIHFWASWCIPCHEQFAYLNTIYDKYSKVGLEMIGVSADWDRSAWIKDIPKSKIERWKHMIGIENTINEAGKRVIDRFAIEAYPTILLIDKSGKIVYRAEGSDGEEMKKLDELIHSSVGK